MELRSEPVASVSAWHPGDRGTSSRTGLDQPLHHYATVIRVSRSPASPSRMSLLREAKKQEAMCLFLDFVAIMPLV